uniref:Uncharacterized protein n=1 Tax=Coccolithus braarudii TaxID=221442 RepID=A0A7S0LP58_9EUKA|mmetsp:Transcript_51161/g.109322  ORF Transcript_51161/g.109322 Transcript_51161/m.109322 type:complete len:326 (+) Transcript_51161:104-1081(+)
MDVDEALVLKHDVTMDRGGFVGHASGANVPGACTLRDATWPPRLLDDIVCGWEGFVNIHHYPQVSRATLERMVEQILHNPSRRAAETSLPQKMREAWRRKALSFKRFSDISPLSRISERSHLHPTAKPEAVVHLHDGDRPPISTPGVAAVQVTDENEWMLLGKGANAESATSPLCSAGAHGGDEQALAAMPQTDDGGTTADSECTSMATPTHVLRDGQSTPRSRSSSEGATPATEPGLPATKALTEAERGLLELPFDLGVDELLASYGGRPGDPLINIAPTVVVAGTSLQQIHMQFSLFSTEHAYVTFAGRYLGVIRRAHLTGHE